MPSAIRPPLQTGTPTRLAVKPDQPLSVQEFLRSLKKSTRPLPTPKRLEAPQDNTLTSRQLTVQGFLHSLRKPVTPTCHEDLSSIDSAAGVLGPGLLDPPESILNDISSEQVLSPLPEANRPQSPNPKGSDEKDVSMKMPKVVRTYAKKTKQVLTVRQDSASLFLTQSSTRDGAPLDGVVHDGSGAPIDQAASREIPRIQPAKKPTSVVLRKRKRQPQQDDEEIRQEDHSEDDADMVMGEKKKRTKRKKRRAPVNELALVTKPPSHEVSPVIAQEAYDSDNAIHLLNGYPDEQVSPASSSPSCERSRKPMRANIGKPVTRIRQQIVIPQREVLAREGFKFPPITPRVTKSPGWRMGSGFDGITLEPSTNRRSQTSRNRKIRHATTPYFLGRPLPKLELSGKSYSIRKSVGQTGISNRQNDPAGPLETRKHQPVRELGEANGTVEDGPPHSAGKTGRKTAFEQVGSSTALLRPPTEKDQPRTVSSSHPNSIFKEPIQRHQTQNKDPETSRAIRVPSKSERHGWLKRRNVDFAIADEDEEEQLLLHTKRPSVHARERGRAIVRNGLDTYLEDTAQGSDFEDEILDIQSSDCPPEPPPSSESEADFPTSPLHAKGLSMQNAGHHIEVPRTSEVPETQERLQESIELDHTRVASLDLGLYSHHRPATTLDSGKYFSKAVQQLDSPVERPRAITRRKSRREPDQDVRGSQVMFGTQKGAHHVNFMITGEERSRKQEGSLELGVTPRLKRKMSNVPFRPPFKESL